MAEITVRAPAKVNLFLEVLKKRRDGYHEINTILQEISLADKIILKETRSPEVIIQCSNPDVPLDNNNLVFKAAILFKKYLAEKKRGIIINIEKNIPVASGLGGGSSDAASTLKGLNRLWGINLKKDMLLNIAAQIGMDAPFFIEGGLCLARGRGERLTPLRGAPEMWFAVTVPSIRVSTAWAYGRLSISSLTKKTKKNKILRAILSADVEKIGAYLFNRLEDVTVKAHREIMALKEKMLCGSAIGTLMSGSGPAVFGLFSTAEEAKKVRHIFKKEEVYVAKSG